VKLADELQYPDIAMLAQGLTSYMVDVSPGPAGNVVASEVHRAAA
jgi:hypothetical protein